MSHKGKPEAWAMQSLSYKERARVCSMQSLLYVGSQGMGNTVSAILRQKH